MNRRSLPVLVLVLAFAGFAGLSCRSTPPKGPPSAISAKTPSTPASAALPAPSALALIGYASSKGICTARVTETGLQNESCIPTPSPVEELRFLGGGDFVAQLESGAVVRASAGVLTTLPLPKESTWVRPEPTIAGLAVGPGTQRRFVVTEDHEVWLGRCAWVGLQDAPTCVSWAFARIAPSPAESDSEPSAWSPSWSETAKPPPGVAVRVEVPPDGAPLRVLCTKDGASSTFTLPGREGAYTTADIGWLGGSSAYYLLTIKHDFLEAYFGEVLLMKACNETSPEQIGSFDIQKEVDIVWGPSGLWMHITEHDGWVLRRREHVLDPLSDKWSPVLAPLPEKL